MTRKNERDQGGVDNRGLPMREVDEPVEPDDRIEEPEATPEVEEDGEADDSDEDEGS